MIIKYIIVAAFVSTILSSCSEDKSSNVSPSNTTVNPKVDQSVSSYEVTKNAINVGKDYHSFANPESIKVTHLNLDLTVDFTKKF